MASPGSTPTAAAFLRQGDCAILVSTPNTVLRKGGSARDFEHREAEVSLSETLSALFGTIHGQSFGVGTMRHAR